MIPINSKYDGQKYYITIVRQFISYKLYDDVIANFIISTITLHKSFSQAKKTIEFNVYYVIDKLIERKWDRWS